MCFSRVFFVNSLVDGRIPDPRSPGTVMEEAEPAKDGNVPEVLPAPGKGCLPETVSLV